jgi:hypothetical protein
MDATNVPTIGRGDMTSMLGSYLVKRWWMNSITLSQTLEFFGGKSLQYPKPLFFWQIGAYFQAIKKVFETMIPHQGLDETKAAYCTHVIHPCP